MGRIKGKAGWGVKGVFGGCCRTDSGMGDVAGTMSLRGNFGVMDSRGNCGGSGGKAVVRRISDCGLGGVRALRTIWWHRVGGIWNRGGARG